LHKVKVNKKKLIETSVFINNSKGWERQNKPNKKFNYALLVFESQTCIHYCFLEIGKKVFLTNVVKFNIQISKDKIRINSKALLPLKCKKTLRLWFPLKITWFGK